MRNREIAALQILLIFHMILVLIASIHIGLLISVILMIGLLTTFTILEKEAER